MTTGFQQNHADLLRIRLRGRVLQRMGAGRELGLVLDPQGPGCLCKLGRYLTW